jgi:large exoprotein involved in heme utilization and adhesion
MGIAIFWQAPNKERGATIDAESLFGIEERPLNDSTNDINASSEFALDGSVNVNVSDINPVQGATELPSNVVEAKQATEQTCSADREGKVNNGLAIAGRGGVSPKPDAPLSSNQIIDSRRVLIQSFPAIALRRNRLIKF